MENPQAPHFGTRQQSEQREKIVPLWKPILTREDVSMYDASKFQKLTFAEAEPIFIAYKRAHRKPETIEMYEMYGRNLRSHFGTMRLTEITIQDIQQYQAGRSQGLLPALTAEELEKRKGKAPKAGASLINHEVNMLSQMLDKAGLWDRLREWYTPVPQDDPQPPKTLTQQEEDDFFKLAATNPDWSLAYWVASLTNNTSAAGCEIRKLRLLDIDLQSSPPKFRVPEGKNRERKWRTIPLNETAYKQMSRIVERALTLGACEPEHFVFPFRVKRNQWDVTKPASESWIKKQWNALREAAGMPWLQRHNLRFQCATRMVAAGVQPVTIKKAFGWKNLKMLEHYNRPQIDLLYEAVSRIEPSAKKQVVSAGKPWMPRFPQKSASQ